MSVYQRIAGQPCGRQISDVDREETNWREPVEFGGLSGFINIPGDPRMSELLLTVNSSKMLRSVGSALVEKTHLGFHMKVNEVNEANNVNLSSFFAKKNLFES